MFCCNCLIEAARTNQNKQVSYFLQPDFLHVTHDSYRLIVEILYFASKESMSSLLNSNDSGSGQKIRLLFDFRPRRNGSWSDLMMDNLSLVSNLLLP